VCLIDIAKVIAIIIIIIKSKQSITFFSATMILKYINEVFFLHLYSYNTADCSYYMNV